MMKRTKILFNIMLMFLLVSIVNVSAFAIEQERTPKTGPNGDSIIKEYEEKNFLPYKIGNEGKVKEGETKTSITPNGIFDRTVKNVRTTTYNLFHPLTLPMRNDYSETNLPILSCSSSDGVTIGAEFNASVEIDAQVVSSEVGYAVSGSRTITAGQEYTYPIPYGQQGTIVLRYSRKSSTFDVHGWAGNKLGSGSSWGLPSNHYVTLQRIYLW